MLQLLRNLPLMLSLKLLVLSCLPRLLSCLLLLQMKKLLALKSLLQSQSC